MNTPCFPAFRSRLAALGRRTPNRPPNHPGPTPAAPARLAARPAALAPKTRAPTAASAIFTLRLTFECFLWQMLKPKTSCREVVRQVQALLRLQGKGPGR